MPTYIPISNTSISGTTSVTFSSIPQTYDDLVIVFSSELNGGFWTSNLFLQINGSSSNIYNALWVKASSSASGWSGQYANASYANLEGAASGTDSANYFSNCEIYFPAYTTAYGKTAHNSNVSEGNTSVNGTTYNTINAVQIDSTSAITSITIYNTGWNSVAPSTFYLYGIKNS